MPLQTLESVPVSSIQAWWLDLPILARITIGIGCFLLVPSVSKRFGVPGVVGLILFGILAGPSALDVWPSERPVLTFLAEVGKLFVLFFAGMEIDLREFRRTGPRALAFGLTTLVLPLAAGAGLALWLGYTEVSAILIGSLIASHTLLGFPILQRAGLASRESVSVTVGATILTDIAAMLILAVCVDAHRSGFDEVALLWQLGKVAAYATVVIAVVSWVARLLLRTGAADRDMQMLILLVIITLTSLAAELAHLEPIVGAFLAGLAVSSVLHSSDAKEHVIVLGNTLFVPSFFMLIGLDINVRQALEAMLANWMLVGGLLLALVVGKFLAAWLAGWMGKYSRDERMLIWSLSLPQVAATIAAALVAYQTVDADGRRLIDEPVLNSVFVLVLLTATLGPLLTGRYAKRLPAAPAVPATSATPAAEPATGPG